MRNVTVDFDATQVNVTASIGVQTLGEHTATSQQASAHADAAMYEVKALRKLGADAGRPEL